MKLERLIAIREHLSDVASEAGKSEILLNLQIAKIDDDELSARYNEFNRALQEGMVVLHSLIEELLNEIEINNE